MTNLTPEKIKAMTAHKRHTIWKRARARTDDEAIAVTKLIEECGLPYSEDVCLKMDDPITSKMFDVISSQKGKEAMIAATARGLPAIAGVEPQLIQVLGVDYGSHNRGTITAGTLVAQCMHSLGYKNSGRKGPMPDGSVAKTAEIFELN